MRPLGRPPMPSAMSRPSEPVETTSISFSACCFAPMRMIEPLPNDRSIWLSAASSAFDLSILAAPVLDPPRPQPLRLPHTVVSPATYHASTGRWKQIDPNHPGRGGRVGETMALQGPENKNI